MASRKARRGTNALEFALIIPALSMMAMGMVDYGWYFLREVQVTNALNAAVRAGSALQPTRLEPAGTCGACVAAVRDHAVEGLADIGITVSPSAVTPTIQRVGGTCALVLDVEIDHDELVGFVPTPEKFHIPAITLAQNVFGCP